MVRSTWYVVSIIVEMFLRAQPATTKFGTKVVTAAYYCSDCENSLYYRTRRDHGCCVSQCPVHYPVKFDADIIIQSGVIDIFLFT